MLAVAGLKALVIGFISNEIALRMALFVTLLAAMVAGVDWDKFIVAVSANWILIVSNAIACSYVAGTLIHSVIYHNTELPFLFTDILMGTLLCSSATWAALRVGCITGLPVFSIVMTFLGSIVFHWLLRVSLRNHTEKQVPKCG